MELPKIKLLPDDISLLTPAQMWGKFFLYASVPDKEDFVKLLEKNNRGIRMAVTVLKNISQDEINWYRETRYWMHVSDEKSMISSAVDRGLKQGREETAAALLKEGDSPEKIARCTKLPLEKILELQEQLTEKA